MQIDNIILSLFSEKEKEIYKRSSNDEKRWIRETYIENNCKCPLCKSYSLVGTSPFENLFMCSDCGNVFCEEEFINNENQ